MAAIIADNIISPLGCNSKENYEAVLRGETAIKRYERKFGVHEPFCAALFSDEQWDNLLIDGYSKYESLIIRSIQSAIANLDVNIFETTLILSTTKGNIEDFNGDNDNQCLITQSAKRIADYFGISKEAITVCNACASGSAALLLAHRLIVSDKSKCVIVSGCDVQSKFIISGFQSLKALSSEPCRPFDIERLGLNAGEAAATIVLSHNEDVRAKWYVAAGASRNDAYNNTTPSPKGEGCASAIEAINATANDIAFINAHGTATMYNDQMESKAIERAGLSSVPVNGLKGHFGHTMGAAGILETIVSCYAIDNNVSLGTKGFEEIGVSGKIDIHPYPVATTRSSFIKIISGFGGCNTALMISKNQCHSASQEPELSYASKVCIKSNGQEDCLKSLYHDVLGSYPKFFKMDGMSQLALLASEKLLNDVDLNKTDMGVILFNKTSSLHADKLYLNTISNDTEYFPSPALFIYTLPNIAISEIAIKHGIKGETCFYIVSEYNQELMQSVIKASLSDGMTKSLITGAIDYINETNFEIELNLIKTN